MVNKIPYFAKYIDDLPTILSIETIMDEQIPIFIRNKNNEIAANINISNIYTDLDRHISRKIFMYYSNTYLYYIIDNKYYVDISHIISNLINYSGDYNKIFNDFSEYICHSIWTIKQDCTYVRRELIDLNTMGRLILKFNTEFSKIFRHECMIYLIFFQYFLFYYFLAYITCQKLEIK
jgi:hypothetical protein